MLRTAFATLAVVFVFRAILWFAEERLLKAIGTEEYDVSGPPSSLTDPDVQISRFRFFMEEVSLAKVYRWTIRAAGSG
jgi:hypothetical protein